MPSTRLLHQFVIIVGLLLANAQPPMGGGPPGGGANVGVSGSGSSASTTCSQTSGACTTNFVDHSLTYDGNTGRLSGSITTNLCPSHTTPMSAEASCETQTIPDPAFPVASSPQAAPLLGRIGLTLKEGNNVYGPLDAGFTDGQVCTGGTCDGGSDLTVCENQLIYQCGEANVNMDMLMDECGGHANPYHHHTDLACDYSTTDSASHSPAIAVSLDGYVVYGKWEGSEKAPTLDACNGHTGPVPADSTYGITAGEVYHYHSTDTPPYLIGCYGPVDSLAACKALYDTCDDTDEITTFFGLDGSEITYNLWCPCYEHSGTAADDDQTPSVAAAASIHAPLLSLFASALALLAAGQRAL